MVITPLSKSQEISLSGSEGETISPSTSSTLNDKNKTKQIRSKPPAFVHLMAGG